MRTFVKSTHLVIRIGHAKLSYFANKSCKKASLWKNEGLMGDAKKHDFFSKVCLFDSTLEKGDAY